VEHDEEREIREQIWLAKSKITRLRLFIPFFVFDLALSDIVEVSGQGLKRVNPARGSEI